MKKIWRIKNLPLRVSAIAIICWFVWEAGLIIFWPLLYLIDALSSRINSVFGYLFLYFVVLSFAGFLLALISIIVSLLYAGVKRLLTKIIYKNYS